MRLFPWRRHRSFADRKALIALGEQLVTLAQDAELRAPAHARLARRWRWVANFVAWGAAAFAALSTVSVFGDVAWVTAMFSILTVLLSTFLASVKPAEAASSHRESKAGYSAVAHGCRSALIELDEISREQYVHRTEVDPTTEQRYDAGFYRETPVSRARLTALRKTVQALNTEHARVLGTALELGVDVEPPQRGLWVPPQVNLERLQPDPVGYDPYAPGPDVIEPGDADFRAEIRAR